MMTWSLAEVFDPEKDSGFKVDPVQIEVPVAEFYEPVPDYEIRYMGPEFGIYDVQRIENRWLVVTGDGFRLSEGEAIDKWMSYSMPETVRVFQVLRSSEAWLIRLSLTGKYQTRFAVSRDLKEWDFFELPGYLTSSQLFVWQGSFYWANDGELKKSEDGKNWSVHLAKPYMDAWSEGWTSHVSFQPMGNYLFASGLSEVWVSEDGVSWGSIFKDQRFRWLLNRPLRVSLSGGTLVVDRELHVTGGRAATGIRLTKRGAMDWVTEEVPIRELFPTVVVPTVGFVQTCRKKKEGDLEYGIFYSADYADWRKAFGAAGVASAPYVAASNEAILADMGGYLLLYQIKDQWRVLEPEVGLPVEYAPQRIPPARFSDVPPLVRQVEELQRAAAGGSAEAMSRLIDIFAEGNEVARRNIPLAMQYARDLQKKAPDELAQLKFAKMLAAFAPETQVELREVLEKACADGVAGSWALFADYQLNTTILGEVDEEKGLEILLKGVSASDSDSLFHYSRVLIYGQHGVKRDLEGAKRNLEILRERGYPALETRKLEGWIVDQEKRIDEEK